MAPSSVPSYTSIVNQILDDSVRPAAEGVTDGIYQRNGGSAFILPLQRTLFYAVEFTGGTTIAPFISGLTQEERDMRIINVDSMTLGGNLGFLTTADNSFFFYVYARDLAGNVSAVHTVTLP